MNSIRVSDIALSEAESFARWSTSDSRRMLGIDSFAIADAVGYGIYVINDQSVITDANRTYRELTGMWPKEFLGKSVRQVLDGFFVNSRAVAVQALETGRKATGLGRPKRVDKDLLVTAIPVFDEQGHVVSVVTVLRDVTEELRLQRQLDKNLEITEIYQQELDYYRSRERGTRLLIGITEGMEQIKTLITQVAPVDTTVLISGETGVGKEVVSHEIHNRSHRKDYPYIKVNCAAIPASLMESELFGYERGAFTGADSKRKLGYFETANHGTILLDEIGEIPLPLQAKLLRVLQERELRRLGGSSPIKVDVRIIASTNKNLKKEVADGLFRRDLYYRLCVIPIEIPPLRERTGDIPILAEHFLNEFNSRYAATKKISLKAFEVFNRYEWPGNVRELENIIERLVVVTKSDIIDENDVTGVLFGVTGGGSPGDASQASFQDSVNRLEKILIENALMETGSSYKAAERLGMNQSTVIRKARKYGIVRWR